MTDVVVMAVPGGNPGLLAAVVWALHAQGLRAERLEVVLYRSAQHYLATEFMAEGGPYAQLLDALGGGAVGRIVPHVVCDVAGVPLEDDSEVDDHLLFAGAVWDVARNLTRSPLPVVFALVGGRRRTLTVDLTTAFQLLARPQDRLVDLRLNPKYADDPGSGFAFPAQRSPCAVARAYGLPPSVDAAGVTVSLVDLLLPRLGMAVGEADKSTFRAALAAGERAARYGAPPHLRVAVASLRVEVGHLPVRLSRSQMVWYLALVLARLGSAEGWVEPDGAGFLERAFRLCLVAWKAQPEDLSDGFDFRPEVVHNRAAWLGPLRSKTRSRFAAALRGHPHRGLVIPQKGPGKAVRERILLDAERIEVVELTV